jgi:hypothetical protein
MNTKKQRREAAQQKAKKKRILILAVCAACVAAVIAAAILIHVNRPAARVFSVPGNQSVTLYEDGRFTARLAHNVNISGTFTEDVSGNVTAISFTHGGNTVSTQIEDDILILPVPWRAACRVHSHEIEFPLMR